MDIFLFSGTANFNAQSGCQKCITTGEFSYMSNTNIFPRSECAKRVDVEFRNKMYGSHHKQDSPILQLNIDMIKQFPVADSLHLLHLGVMKRLLFGWRDGTFRNSDTKWRAQTTNAVTYYLMNQCKMPAEFHRAVRGLDCLSHWKGTEYRTFLHYIGPVVLKDHLTMEAYQHFLLLFCSVTICSSKQYFRMLPIARSMLLKFIEIFAEIYGKHYITSNVHNLSHLVDDVEHLGELDSFSAYPFENVLGKIKRLPRNGNRPLAQVAKRLMEDLNCYLAITETQTVVEKNRYPILSKRNNGDNVPNRFKTKHEQFKFYHKFQTMEYCLGTDKTNCWFLTKDNAIACVENIMFNTKDESIKLCCREIQNQSQLFILPIESKLLDIYTAAILDSNVLEMKVFIITDIKSKLVCLEYHRMHVFFPLLHTNNA